MNRAAFFDVDGTLTEMPSLERRYFRALRREGKVSLRNGIAWLVEFARLLPNGLTHALQGNKAYLRAVRASGLRANRAGDDAPFFPEAMECVARHGDKAGQLRSGRGKFVRKRNWQRWFQKERDEEARRPRFQ